MKIRPLFNRQMEASVIINTDDLLEKDLQLKYEENQVAFEGLADIVAAGDIEFVQTIHFDLRAYRIGERVVADGRFDAPVRYRCSRCLTEFDSSLASDFRLTYSRNADGPDHQPGGTDVELEADTIGMLSFSGQHVDLRPALQEELILALPIQPLCAQACKGLCSKCGANLNQGNCGCSKQRINPQFAALKNMKIK